MYGLGTIQNMNKSFKVKDRIDYQGNLGTIIKIDVPVKDDNGKLGALVEWDNDQLVPPQMAVPYRFLLYAGQSLPVGQANVSIATAGNSGNQTFNVDVPEVKMNDERPINPDVACPACGSIWTKTPHQTGVWYDCVKCNKTKEDIVGG